MDFEVCVEEDFIVSVVFLEVFVIEEEMNGERGYLVIDDGLNIVFDGMINDSIND